jgi:hypothetical protein
MRMPEDPLKTSSNKPWNGPAAVDRLREEIWFQNFSDRDRAKALSIPSGTPEISAFPDLNRFAVSNAYFE